VSVSFYGRHQHRLPCRVWRRVPGWLRIDRSRWRRGPPVRN